MFLLFRSFLFHSLCSLPFLSTIVLTYPLFSFMHLPSCCSVSILSFPYVSFPFLSFRSFPFPVICCPSLISFPPTLLLSFRSCQHLPSSPCGPKCRTNYISHGVRADICFLLGGSLTFVCTSLWHATAKPRPTGPGGTEGRREGEVRAINRPETWPALYLSHVPH